MLFKFNNLYLCILIQIFTASSMVTNPFMGYSGMSFHQTINRQGARAMEPTEPVDLTMDDSDDEEFDVKPNAHSTAKDDHDQF